MEWFRCDYDGNIWIHPDIKTLDDFKAKFSQTMIDARKYEERLEQERIDNSPFNRLKKWMRRDA